MRRMIYSDSKFMMISRNLLIVSSAIFFLLRVWILIILLAILYILLKGIGVWKF